eukprot:5261586-Amphidinium_carterae.2
MTEEELAQQRQLTQREIEDSSNLKNPDVILGFGKELEINATTLAAPADEEGAFDVQVFSIWCREAKLSAVERSR